MQAVNGLPTFNRRYAAKKWSCHSASARDEILEHEDFLICMGVRLRLHPRLYALVITHIFRACLGAGMFFVA